MASERRSSQAAWSASANQPCAMSVKVCLMLRSVARAAPCCASFNGKFRAECLNAHWYMSLDDARRRCEAWRRDYNEERPHSAIGNKAPIELIDRSVAYGPR